jgi:hypothetical protein
MTNMDELQILATFAGILGWPDLNARHYGDITWYERGDSDGFDDDLFFQINPSPPGSSYRFVGGVYALRYQICTGWHPFTITDSRESIDAEATRLDCWLNRRWFSTPEMGQEFERLHPECANYTWEKVRAVGVPYPQSRD